MSQKEGKKEVKEKAKKYTYFQIVSDRNAIAQALMKITTLYFPDIGEMNKLTPLSLECKRIESAYSLNRDKILESIDRDHPLPEKSDESKEAKETRIKRGNLLEKKVVELLNKECDFNFKDTITLDQDALQVALEKESTSKPKESNTLCPECGALVKTFDPEKKILNSLDLAYLNDWVIIKKQKKKKEK